ncbi:MAG TPA: CcdB family protein [Burkholderiaceae bacterium]|nr:CcdB family protein [Burkholderiaceae bacterium]HMX10745.1 CcdB family protein [Burkholderiaceae bacterium]HMY99678.1 CcdB family protein [Burkholderiaceae bacterium]HNB45436.1 CcdB family protein [Burkholderiaceae bacterium]HNG79233.1 CcdB family protein [Burkholderiaceae bacterium]
MARFDLFANTDPRASHGLYLDVQSDLVQTPTRWCVPLRRWRSDRPLLRGAQQLIQVDGDDWVLDTPNILAVPAALLRHPVGRLSPDDHLRVEASLDFMLRGY